MEDNRFEEMRGGTEDMRQRGTGAQKTQATL